MGTANKQLWEELLLKDVVKVKNGNAFKSTEYSDFGIPIIRMSDIENGKITIQKSVKVPEKKEYDKYIIDRGDILIGMSGSIGKYGVFDLNEKVYLNQRVGNLKILNRNRINPSFLYYLIGKINDDIIDKAYGGTVPNISTAQLENTKILLPPLPEQQRIVAKLDVFFAHLEQVKQRMEQIPVLLKQFRQAVLTQAVTGKLTEEWRDSNAFTKWKYELASECCEKVQSGGTPKADGFSTAGIPFLKVYNIVNDKIDFEYRPQFITDEAHNKIGKKSIGLPGDVIMNIVGPPLNKISILTNDFPEWNFNQAITMFRPKAYLSNKFLFYFFQEGTSVKSVTNETRGVVGQVNISLSQCRSFKIPLPPIEEQSEIVRRVEGLFSKADAIEAQYKKLKEQIDQLPQAILAKAFRGEI